MDQTTIKTLYVFVEIGIDSSHLHQTIRLNFPDDRNVFHEALLDSEESDAQIPAGEQLAGPSKHRHLRIEAPQSPQISNEDTSESPELSVSQPTDAHSTRLALVSTIQFVAALQRLKDDISVEYTDLRTEVAPVALLTSNEESSSTSDPLSKNVGSSARLWTGKYDATIPRSKPLSPGEILGCTAPKLEDVDALMYAAVFH